MPSSLRQFVYRHRLIGKRVVAVTAALLPVVLSRRLRGLAERVAFSLTPQYQGETLPPIFHYWSSRYLAPMARALGIGSPEGFYLQRIREQALRVDGPVQVLSLGSGRCGMEIDLVQRLVAEDVDVHLRCVDFNPALMRAAARSAADEGLEANMTFEVLDCNRDFALAGHDVIIVNQFLHHVEALEGFCRSLRRSLADDGMLLSSDIVGRNGHLPWPAVDQNIQQLFAQLPEGKRADRHFGNASAHYRHVDHAAYSNEGVRAQDIVACLDEAFDFELFFTFGGCVMPFVERRIGFNLDPADAGDRDFIDRVQAIDGEALAGGHYPASNMIASLRHKGRATAPRHVPVSPQRHIELTRQQHDRCTTGR